MLQGSFELTSASSLNFSPKCRLTNGLREDIRKPKEKKHKHRAIKRQRLRTENVIVEWQRAQEMLPALQEAAEKDDIRSIEVQPGSTVPHESPKLRSSSALTKNQETILAVIEAAAASMPGSESEKRALVLRNTDTWLNQLLSEWTVLSGKAPEIKRDVNQNTPEELSHEDKSPAPNVEASEHGRKDYHPTKAKCGGHIGDLDVRIKRAEEELAKLREEKRFSLLLGQPSTPTRDYQDGRIYEELEPSGFYSEEGYHYREKEPRTTSGKYDVFEPERRPDVREFEKERESIKRPEKAANDLSLNIALKMEKAKEIAKQKMQEKEAMDKQNDRRAYIDDDSSSDSDAASYVTTNRSLPRISKSTYNLPLQPKLRPEPTRRPTPRREKEEDEEKDKRYGRMESARESIEHSRRPGLSGRTSSSRSYWESPEDRQSGRKDSSDSNKRPRSFWGRR